uniref:SH3 domain-containing protein n=1 Tax=Bionectria ochroleuca TaxID=29856 RepID=A0A8H7KFY6_BIOOC
MTRPMIVRADTIDLQNPDAPSAKNHGRQHLHPTESTAPHQASTLREVAHETAEEEARSPHLSWTSGFATDESRKEEQEDLAAGVRGRMTQQEQEDQLAIAQNGGVSSSDEGEDDGDLDDDMMDRISSSPSIEDEDIDFDFVYALHTFVATVEGQANATKGDTMVLLDDSNSYWWLVRVVKDSSIGYLPAEHIETPTERLARWNKHRNVDLSAAMLGDNPQKQKSTLNKIRKRWKTVTFTEPTYVDYSDIDYSSDEEDIEELFGRDVTAGSGQQDQDQQQDQKDKQDKEQQDSQAASDDDMVDERATVEPLKTGSAGVSKVDSKEEAKADGTKDGDDVEIETRDSTELLGGHVDMIGRSRNGTMRNTDSFFKDDTAETKKITLTPNLLRDDLGSRPSTDSIVTKDKARPSLESKMDREFVSDKDKKKQKEKEKKEKEKKPSTIRSFFSRKDKKRTSEDDDNSSGKRSMDVMSEPRQSEDPMADEQSDKQPRSAAKPQKPQARVEPSLVRKNSTQKKSSEITNPFSETRTNDVSNVPLRRCASLTPRRKRQEKSPRTSNRRPVTGLRETKSQLLASHSKHRQLSRKGWLQLSPAWTSTILIAQMPQRPSCTRHQNQHRPRHQSSEWRRRESVALMYLVRSRC